MYGKITIHQNWSPKFKTFWQEAKRCFSASDWAAFDTKGQITMYNNAASLLIDELDIICERLCPGQRPYSVI